MKKYYLLLIAILFFQSQTSFACGCTTDGSFLEVSTEAELIAVVEVQDYLSYEEMMGEDVPMSMSVKIKYILKGEESANEIVVWGNNGFMCSPYLSLFDIGTTWVMSFKNAPTEGHKNANIEDYGISNCGENFMKVQNGTVSGLINGGNTYQSMSIATLKKNLDIINREESRIDRDKCLFIKELRQLGVDTIGVFENCQINNIIRKLTLKSSFQMSIDEQFPAFYDYMKEANIYRQVFVYWKVEGKTYVKQIDNLFEYEPVVTNESIFFDIYFNHSKWLIAERLHLPKKVISNPLLESPEFAAKGVGNKVDTAPQYLLQSVQYFINGSVFLRDFDTRLFDESYNPKFYKKNQKMLTYDWLQTVENETTTIAIANEKSNNLFEQYKRSMVIL
ncbi:MAG: hypothetical protein AB8G11_22545 [Saprospiraceae bacterium]